MERWVRGCAAQIGCFSDLSGLPMGPFYLKIGLDKIVPWNPWFGGHVKPLVPCTCI